MFGKIRMALVLALIGMLMLCMSAAAQDSQTDMDAQVDGIFRGVKAVGGAFVVAQHGDVVYERYYGVQQKTTQVPVTDQSYFRCASVTKLVTGIGLMKMMDEGMLAPDEDISAYLGYTVRNPQYKNTPVTLRMLMSHTAGLVENASFSKKSSILSDMIDVKKKAGANFKEDVKPGTEYAYSNFGAGITGAIVESVTGKDVSSFMREFLFEPLGIDAAYSAAQLAQPEYLCATYHKDGSLYAAPSYLLKQEYQQEATPDTHYRVTIGSLLIRPRDLAKLGIALCGDGTVDGVRVLSEEAIAAMRQEHSLQTDGITAESPYTFFTIRQDTLFEGRRVYGHQGTDEGVVCNLYVEPESELVIVVMSNGCKTVRDDGIMRMTRRLAALAEEAYIKGNVEQ
ncbi:MAG: beta-lactamase family protein [Clostridia bacterium]|nr:beta-lactamase family protein [Clostridia bacterium]